MTRAQVMEAIVKGEKASFIAKKNFKSKRSGQAYDIVYQKLKLNIDPNPAFRNIYGSVYSELVALEDEFSLFAFDLDSRMTVDSVVYSDSSISFIHANDEVLIDVPSQAQGSKIDVEVFYKGDPSQNEQKGFSYDYQLAGPIAWSLSQPYGAYGWWPCKQQLEDKIDSIDLEITIPKNNKAASLGLLHRVDTLADSSLVFHWKHRYPVATYLVAVAVSNYYEESHYIHLSDGDSVFHLDYIYPSYKSQADILRWEIDGMMRGFDSLFGHYPFREEKYGHAMFARGGGMEHQTMSFMGSLDFDLMAHELGHQWFGDKITCKNWQDLWLNEGWATYTNALARELVKDDSTFLAFISNALSDVLDEDDGSVFAYDTSIVRSLFSGRLRYYKGSLVLHQLRWEVGDDAFFEGTRNYMANAEYCYGFAETIDFQEAIEEASGKDLDGFFDRYIYKEGFPIVLSNWNRVTNKRIKLDISQETSHPSVSFFPLKIEYQALGEGRDTFFVVDLSDSEQEFDIDLGFKVTELRYDPRMWLLARGNIFEKSHSDLSNINVFPNPSGQSISLLVQEKKIDSIELLDLQGRVIQSMKVTELKSGQTNVDLSGLANGIYLLRAYSGNETLVSKFMKRGQ